MGGAANDKERKREIEEDGVIPNAWEKPKKRKSKVAGRRWREEGEQGGEREAEMEVAVESGAEGEVGV